MGTQRPRHGKRHVPNHSVNQFSFRGKNPVPLLFISPEGLARSREHAPRTPPVYPPDLYDDNDVGDVVTKLTGSPEFEY